MFIGTFDHKGILTDKIVTADGYQFVIEVDDKLIKKINKNISINGCSLNIARISGNKIVVDVTEEIINRTNFDTLKQNMSVNCEVPLSSSERQVKNFVTGNIDTIGRIEGIIQSTDSYEMIISYPEIFIGYLILNRLVTIDGVTMSITEIKDSWFTVNIDSLIWEKTIFIDKQPGDTVNLEFDNFSKFVVGLLETNDWEDDSISED